MEHSHKLARIMQTLGSAALTGTLLISLAPRVHADEYDRCRHRIEHADHELHEAIERHGRNSPEADRKRHELHEAREHCWSEYHRWWDEHEHRWHTERDWDDRDHDRDFR